MKTTSIRRMAAPRIAALGLLALGYGAMLAISAPGQLSYDSIAQLQEGRTGLYNSWHPPVMAWLLGLFDSLLPGTLLYLVFAGALASLALALLLRRPGWGAVLVLGLMMLTPQWLMYQGIVWKDVLFANAALLGFVALGRSGGRVGGWLALSLACLVLAALVRQNGVVLLPVAAACLARMPRRQGRPWRRAMAFLGLGLLLGAGLDAALALRGDGGDGAASEIRLAQSYDIAGMLRNAPQTPLPVLEKEDPGLAALLKTRGARLYTPLQNNPIAADPALSDAISAAPQGALLRQWESLIRERPGLYLSVRWADFRQVAATPDLAACHPLFAGIEGAPATLAALELTPRQRPQDRALLAYAAAFMGTPVFSHLAFAALALGLLLLPPARRRQDDIAMAGLLAGALLFALSFFFLSIACDYRYLYLLDLAAMAALLQAAARD